MGGGGGLGGGGCWDAPAARRPATSLPSYARRGTSLACATARRPGKEGGRPRGGWIHWDLLTLRLGATGNPLLRTVRYIVLLNTRGISTIRVQFRLGLYLADLADFTSAARRHRCRRRGGGGEAGAAARVPTAASVCPRWGGRPSRWAPHPWHAVGDVLPGPSYSWAAALIGAPFVIMVRLLLTVRCSGAAGGWVGCGGRGGARRRERFECAVDTRLLFCCSRPFSAVWQAD